MTDHDSGTPPATYLETGPSLVWPPEGTHAVSRLASDHSKGVQRIPGEHLVTQVRLVASDAHHQTDVRSMNKRANWNSLSDLDAVLAARERQLLESGWGEWLNTYPWQFFCTLTFKYRVSTTIARAACSRWLQRLGQRAHHKVFYFCVLEQFASGAPHIHGVINAGDTIDADSIRAAWGLVDCSHEFESARMRRLGSA